MFQLFSLIAIFSISLGEIVHIPQDFRIGAATGNF